MSSLKIHPHFKLNQQSFTAASLKKRCHQFIEEGKDFEQAIGQFVLAWLDMSANIEVQTSGSTGHPKRIQLRKAQMINSARATGSFFNNHQKTKALLCLPAEFIAGKMMLVRAMELGWELDYVAPNSNPLESVIDSYDFSAMVPLQVEKSIEKLRLIKKLIVGGAAVSRNLKNKLSSLETEVFETYGMTETITHIAAKRLPNQFKQGDDCFKTLPEVIISKDKRGCLVIEAPHVSDVVVVTNDLVDIISPKAFQWLGRYDNVINSGGVKLIPEQIEAKLSTIIANRFFVIGIPDEQLGQKLALVVEGEIDITIIEEKIKALKNLSKYQIPKEIYKTEKFVEVGNGKISREKTLKLI